MDKLAFVTLKLIQENTLSLNNKHYIYQLIIKIG